MATITPVNASTAPNAVGSYAQAVKVTGFEELVFISGQIPEKAGGKVPADFDSQCRLVWKNVQALLAATGLSLGDLVQVTTYLSYPSKLDAQSQIRTEVLGGHCSALTVIFCDFYSSKWLMEIEAIAAR